MEDAAVEMYHLCIQIQINPEFLVVFTGFEPKQEAKEKSVHFLICPDLACSLKICVCSYINNKILF